ncbi:adenine nucleotide translocase lysine N-methyltransferase-like isoform X5 [Zootoca vivipara]|uniref:adenine nucleotide translocase lysine N-methyltransferase-like isoform X5 n=1 Tax=Zootoca vivipara TaxID=8524 RepID=UPI00159240B4|nr:adenine nucleotide translocase lysine N-methyltransferase-like isoform X5 [Zootoca vivipara]
MDHDNVEKLAAELHEKGSAWGPFQIAASTSLVLYFAWAGSLALGLRKVYLQVPYVPSSVKQVRNMMSLLQGRSGKLVDLGSGDGRIVLEAYKQGFRPSVGYELNPWLLQLSNFRAWRAGCYGNVFFRREDLWKISLTATTSLCSWLPAWTFSVMAPALWNALPLGCQGNKQLSDF